MVGLFAGLAVSEYQRALTWYKRLLGSEPAFLPNATEAVWELAEHRYLYIAELPERAGRALLRCSSTTSMTGSAASGPGAYSPRVRCVRTIPDRWLPSCGGSAILPRGTVELMGPHHICQQLCLAEASADRFRLLEPAR